MLAGQAAMTGGVPMCSNVDMSVLGDALPSTTTSSLELSLRCQDLPKSDLFSKSDPMAVVYVRQSPSSSWVEAGRTEVLKDEHQPKWANKVYIYGQFAFCSSSTFIHLQSRAMFRPEGIQNAFYS